MASYKGVIIEESLEDKSILDKMKIASTKVEGVTPKHQTPWLTKWTLHNVEILEDQADEIAKEISSALESERQWYADFKNDTHHYIIFKDKVFYIDRTSQEQYEEVKEYGISLGIPDYQVDFRALKIKFK